MRGGNLFRRRREMGLRQEVEALQWQLYCLQLETEDLREFCREVSCSRFWRDSGRLHLRRRHRHVNRRCVIR